MNVFRWALGLGLWTLLFGPWTLDGFSQYWKSQNVATTIEIYLRDTTTNNGKTGVAATSIACDLTKASNTLSSTKTTFTAAASGSTHDAVEVAHGKYNLEIPAADLDTIGTATIECQCSGAYDSKNTIQVISAASFAVNFNGDISDNSTIASAVVDQAIGSHTTSGSLGALLNTTLDTPLSTISTAVTALPATLLDLPDGIETNYTLRQALRIILATQAGKLSGVNANTPTFRDVNDTKNRVVSTTDQTGRTAVTLDPN